MNKYSVYSIAKLTDWRLAASKVWPWSVFHSSQPLAERPIKAMLGLANRCSRVEIVQSAWRAVLVCLGLVLGTTRPKASATRFVCLADCSRAFCFMHTAWRNFERYAE